MDLKERNEQVIDEASRWFIECRSGELDAADRREFVRWLKRSPEHVCAYMEISEAYSAVPEVQALQGPVLAQLTERLRARLENEPNVLPLEQAQISVPASRATPGPRKALALRPIWIAATSVLCVATFLIWRLVFQNTYATDIGEQRAIDLEDGSRVELNAGSKIQVRYSAHQRRIDLLRGQALFQAARDERRPFTVTSGETRVQALGTRFDVDRRASRTIVSVIEGRVALLAERDPVEPAPSSGSAAPPAMPLPAAVPMLLVAGEQAVITSNSAHKAEHANAAASIAWTHGEVEFDQTPLGEVADEFNRHNRRILVIDGADLANLRITCVYSLDDADSLIRFLRSQPDLTVSEAGTEIHVTRKK